MSGGTRYVYMLKLLYDSLMIYTVFRLDRLILLLETGSTPSVRLTAARQLGSIAGVRVSHPTTKITGIKSEDVGAVGITNENSNAWRGVEGEWNEVINLVARVSLKLSVVASYR